MGITEVIAVIVNVLPQRHHETVNWLRLLLVAGENATQNEPAKFTNITDKQHVIDRVLKQIERSDGIKSTHNNGHAMLRILRGSVIIRRLTK